MKSSNPGASLCVYVLVGRVPDCILILALRTLERACVLLRKLFHSNQTGPRVRLTGSGLFLIELKAALVLSTHMYGSCSCLRKFSPALKLFSFFLPCTSSLARIWLFITCFSSVSLLGARTRLSGTINRRPYTIVSVMEALGTLALRLETKCSRVCQSDAV